MNSDALAFLAAKGLSLDEIVEFARLSERKVDRTNADRQARYRDKRKAKKDGAVTRYSNGVTPPIEEDHTPQTNISSDEESQSVTRDDVSTVIESWNATAAPLGLPTCRKLTGERLKSCRARLKDDGLQAIQAAIQHIPKSSFLRGETGSWSGANITFLLRPDTVTKILEGQYDDRNNRNNSGPTALHRNNVEQFTPAQRRLAELRAAEARGRAGCSDGPDVGPLGSYGELPLACARAVS